LFPSIVIGKNPEERKIKLKEKHQEVILTDGDYREEVYQLRLLLDSLREENERLKEVISEAIDSPISALLEASLIELETEHGE